MLYALSGGGEKHEVENLNISLDTQHVVTWETEAFWVSKQAEKYLNCSMDIYLADRMLCVLVI